MNLASGRGNIGAELSSGGHFQSMVMNRGATPANTLDQWLYAERWKETDGKGGVGEKRKSNLMVSQVTKKRKTRAGSFDSAQPLKKNKKNKKQNTITT